MGTLRELTSRQCEIETLLELGQSASTKGVKWSGQNVS